MLTRPPAKAIQAILWDMDGTILDTETLSDKAIFEAFGDRIPHAKQLRERLNERLPWDIKLPTLGKRGDEWVPMVLDYAVKYWGVRDPPAWEDIFERQENILNSYCKDVQECKGATKLVQELAALGVPQCIATSSRMSSVVKKREHHDAIFKHMETIVSGDMIEHAKPAPDIYLETAKRMRVDPTKCLVFEDSVAGAQAGKAAGCYVIGVPDPRMDHSDFDGIADEVFTDLTCFDFEAWGLVGQETLN